jgi:type II secretory pathway component PulF
VAAELDRGRSLEDCLDESGRVPPHLAGLIRAARRTAAVGPMLAEWIENRRAARQHWQGVVAALAYPVVSLFLFAVVFIVFASFVVPPFRQLVEEIGIRLPFNTRAIFWLSGTGAALLVTVAGVTALGLVALRTIGGRAAWSWLMTNLPLVGPAWHWTGSAEMLRCLSLLVRHDVPLPEALRLAAGGIADGYVGQQCRRLASQIEGGASLTMSLIELRTLPLSIVPLVHWGERQGALAEALRAAAEMLEGRLRMKTAMLGQVIPPVIFVFVGIMVCSLVGMIAGTLIPVLQGLT